MSSAPSDDNARLVAADWLEEHGQPERAEYIRAACLAEAACDTPDQRADLLDRAETLEASHEHKWLAPWRDDWHNWTWKRGFLRVARMPADAFVEQGESLFASEPVEFVDFFESNGDSICARDIERVVSNPAFRHMQKCFVDDGVGEPASLSAWLKTLVDNKHVVSLKEFVSQSAVSTKSAEKLVDQNLWLKFFKAQHLSSLESLEFQFNRHVPTSFLAGLVNAKFASNLRALLN